MINEKENPVAWQLFLSELTEARTHLEDLIYELSKDGAVKEESLAVDLAGC